MSLSFETGKEAAAYMEENSIDYLDACFVDPLGMWHHTTFHKSACEAKDFDLGFAFDGSSIKLFTKVENSDMVMRPDMTTCWVDPFYHKRTMHVTSSITDCENNVFQRCPRGIARRTEEYLVSTGIADKAFFGPEAEFFIFDHVRFSTASNRQFFEVDGLEAHWNNDKDLGGSNLAHRMPPKSSYFPVPPIDEEINLRTDMLEAMASIGIPVEKHHHEVASCQHELGFTCRTLVECADLVMGYKYCVKNVAKKHKKSATFMPKPIFGDNGSGMHCHQSLWKNGKNLFWDENGDYQKLSQMAKYYIGGLLKHASSVLAFTNPTVNSYKRLVPGYEAPSSLVYSKGNRSAAIRIPLLDSNNPKAKRIEFRCPDAMCNPYLAYAAMTMAGMDGIINKIDPPSPCDSDIYELSSDLRASIKSTPASLEEVMDALEQDHDYLTRGNVFPADFIQAYIAFKRAEAGSISLVPTPKEYELYYHG